MAQFDWPLQSGNYIVQAVNAERPLADEYTPVYREPVVENDDLGFPHGMPEHLMPQPIADTMTYRVLYKWREKFGLSMTAHLLCHVMQRPWKEIRNELCNRYVDGYFSAVNCSDIQDVAYYVEYPFPIVDPSGDYYAAVYNRPSYLEYSDQKIAEYPPDRGFINSWHGEGRTTYAFRLRAFGGKDMVQCTAEQIIETLRAACHAK